MWLFKRNKKEVVIDTPKEVTDSKKQLKNASNAASSNTKKLKRVLTADHVTLRIHVATQGVKHG